ncbi:MAG: antiterminator LoaP [Spirochaetaceae bacterium]|jgi:transcriptional antiterminator NusG|nr:antiterminator LoaP [Spirochaetaceae bacterium]
MNYYAIQVKTRTEERYIRLFRARRPDFTAEIHFPRRQIDERRRGRVTERTVGIFPGYIFVGAEADEFFGAHWDFRRTDGFFRFLRSNQDVRELQGRDLELVLHFIKKVGPVAGKSRVYFNEQSRVVVVDGPLLGLEGKIVKVDRRKGRAKIKLDLYDDSFSIDLAFEVIQPAQSRVIL